MCSRVNFLVPMVYIIERGYIILDNSNTKGRLEKKQRYQKKEGFSYTFFDHTHTHTQKATAKLT